MRNTIVSLMTAMALTACAGPKENKGQAPQGDFNYVVDQFADLQILRYQVPGFESLSLKQKQLLYHLSQAALMGRDIFFDQNCRYNLPIRRTLETIYTTYKGNREDAQFKALETYLKRVWFSSGIHHHYAEDKFVPGFTPEFFKSCLEQVDVANLPLREGQTLEQFVAEISPVIFDPSVLAKRTVQSGDQDLILASANNYYGEGVTEKEVEGFYSAMKAGKDTITPISYGLNSRLVKENGKIVEKVWKVGSSGRIAKWAVEIMGETISFAPRKAIKSQVLADFVAEWVGGNHLLRLGVVVVGVVDVNGVLVLETETDFHTRLATNVPLAQYVRRFAPLGNFTYTAAVSLSLKLVACKGVESATASHVVLARAVVRHVLCNLYPLAVLLLKSLLKLPSAQQLCVSGFGRLVDAGIYPLELAFQHFARCVVGSGGVQDNEFVLGQASQSYPFTVHLQCVSGFVGTPGALKHVRLAVFAPHIVVVDATGTEH